MVSEAREDMHQAAELAKYIVHNVKLVFDRAACSQGRGRETGGTVDTFDAIREIMLRAQLQYLGGDLALFCPGLVLARALRCPVLTSSLPLPELVQELLLLQVQGPLFVHAAAIFGGDDVSRGGASIKSSMN
eukprot:845257-Rhodomonas_salina.1